MDLRGVPEAGDSASKVPTRYPAFFSLAQSFLSINSTSQAKWLHDVNRSEVLSMDLSF